MWKHVVWGCLATCLSVVLSQVGAAAELAHRVDLSAFSMTPQEETAADFDTETVVPVSLGDDTSFFRPYVTGIFGASFATLGSNGSFDYGTFDRRSVDTTGSINQTLFTGGGGIGAALAPPSGLLRMEVEGRARGPMDGSATLTFGPTEPAVLTEKVAATGGWSTMVNFWRDYFVGDTFGVYAGGGFGVGGYQVSGSSGEIPAGPGTTLRMHGSNAVNSFAWQAGTGLTYQWSQQVTFDVGYRFFAIAPGQVNNSLTATYSQDGSTSNQSVGTYMSALSASELLLSVRIYEPFRNLLR